MFCQFSLSGYLYVLLLSTQYVLPRNCDFQGKGVQLKEPREPWNVIEFNYNENITIKDYVYTLFALFEYSVVYTNIAYHYKSGNIFGSSILIISSDQTYNLLPSWSSERSSDPSCHFFDIFKTFSFTLPISSQFLSSRLRIIYIREILKEPFLFFRVNDWSSRIQVGRSRDGRGRKICSDSSISSKSLCSRVWSNFGGN